MCTQRGRPAATVVLTAEERESLERWPRRPSTALALALRSRIVLAAADGQANSEIGATLGCHPATAGKWRRRFVAQRLDGLSDEPRPGAPRTISDEQVEAVIVKSLERNRATRPTGRPARWPPRWACCRPQSPGSVAPLGSSRTWSSSSGSHPTAVHRQGARHGWPVPETRPRRPSCSAWTRRPRSRHSTAPRQRGPCCPACRAASPTVTCDTGPPTSTPRSTTCPALDAGSLRAT